MVMAAALSCMLAAVQAQPIHVDAQVDKDRIALGDPFTLTISIEHPSLDTYALPAPVPVAPLTLRGPPQVSRTKSGDQARTTFTIPLTDYRTLEPQIPALTFAVDGPDGPREFTLPPQPLELRSLVAEERAPTLERAHHGPKQPVPVVVRSFLWAFIAGAVVLAAVALYAWSRYRKYRAALLAAPAPPPTPEDEAMGRLSSLKRRAPWERGLGRAAVFELSEIVRDYLGKRLQFPALDLTTDEVVDELKRRRILGLDLAGLRDDFAWQDLVKFAKAEPGPEDCVHAIDRAASLVDRARGFLPTAVPQERAS
ncbi:MAG: protein BatD [Deltaproteobacteria bacterium]|nr:MAG: protein BatD [Deltaproteobacteria bacterium]TMB36076.1 MAG: protein BatD [Deltaproteobacteria bacterium]